MKEFKNIPSKLYEKTENWIVKEKNLTKTKYSNNFQESKPKPRRIMSASACHSHRNLQPGNAHIICNYKINNKKKGVSMFENYYHDKMVEKKIIPSQEEEKAQQLKDDLDYQFEAHLRELRNCNNIESQINEQYESIKKAQIKANTPSINDNGIILKKNNKNLIEENKQKIIKGEIPKKIPVNKSNDNGIILKKNNKNFIEENKQKIIKGEIPKKIPVNKSNDKSSQNNFHKDFGKTPQYLKNMKIEAEKKKELDILKKEQEKYPKGTRLLSEEERMFTLNKLLESKKEIENLLAKLPITLNSQAAKNKQEELYKKLDEMDKAIATFSKKKVFVKIDS